LLAKFGLGFHPEPLLRTGRVSSLRGRNPSEPSDRGEPSVRAANGRGGLPEAALPASSRPKGRLAGAPERPDPRPASLLSNGRLPKLGRESEPLRGPLRPAPAPYERPPSLPGLLLGRGPPARGLPLLVVNGRAKPPSLRKGLAELDLPVSARPGTGRLEFALVGRSVRGESTIGSICSLNDFFGPRSSSDSGAARRPVSGLGANGFRYCGRSSPSGFFQPGLGGKVRPPLAGFPAKGLPLGLAPKFRPAD
jgi:hypothetical protein